MIHYLTPYSVNGNLGKAYNAAAKLIVNPEDWIVFLDGDTCFLTADYGKIILENLAIHGKDCGLISCLTNRVGNKEQCYMGLVSEDPNILNHIKTAEKLSKEKRHEIAITDRVISGHLMAIQKKTWDLIGGADHGLLGVDTELSRRVWRKQLKIGILQGLYIFHKYRINTNRYDVSHLK
jgi:GT2 family glycosyltransferase